MGESKIQVDTPELRALRARTELEPCRPGTDPSTSALPGVTLPCLGGGRSIDLSSLHGPMLISLWSSACGPCRVEMPVLEDFHQEYGDQVPVLGIDFADTYPGVALQQIAKREVTYPNLADPGGDLLDTEQFRRVLGLPFLGFVNAGGDIVYVKFGGVTSVDEVADLVRDRLGVDL